MKHAIWILEIIGKLGMDLDVLDVPFQICEDNAAALVIATTGRQRFGPSTLVCGTFGLMKTEAGEYDVVKVGTKDMLADILSKVLGPVIFCGLKTRIGVVDCS